MAVQNDQPITLQQDNITAVPVPVRTIVAQVMVNGINTPVALQVVALSDGAGNVIDSFADYNWQREMLSELRQLRALFAQQLGIFQPIMDIASKEP